MISKRLKVIASLISNDSTVADIGCDHGYLEVLLRQQGNNCHLVATDLRKGPLANAAGNLELYGIGDVELILTDGVQNVGFQADEAVIAGMGYHSAIKIITTSRSYFDNCSRIIIQINTDVDKLRRWLMENGFVIIDETMVKDRKYYEILTVTSGHQILTEQQISFGPVFLERRDPLFLERYRMLKRKLEGILERIPEDNPDRSQLIGQIAQINEIL